MHLLSTKFGALKRFNLMQLGVCMILLLLWNISSAQTQELYFNKLNRNDGISSNRVNCIMEDKMGFIWFGTVEGLNKYNGRSFEVFKNDPLNNKTLIDNNISCIINDYSTKNMWIGTSRGLVYFDRSTNSFISIFEKNEAYSFLANTNIFALVWDNSNDLWISTNNGIFVLDATALIIKRIFSTAANNSIRSNRVHALMKDRAGQIWVGHDSGVDLFQTADSTFIPKFVDYAIGNVYCLFEDNKGGIWLGSDDSGLYHFNDPNGKLTKHYSIETGEFTQNRVHGIYQTHDNEFFIFVRDGGLYRLNNSNNKLEHYLPDIHYDGSISSKGIISGFRSSDGIVWLGTYNAGVTFYDPRRKNFGHYKLDFRPAGIFNDNIRSLCEDSEGYIWIGTKEGGGLSRLDRKSDSFLNIEMSDRKGGLNDDYIFSVEEYNMDQLLVGTFRKGLAIYNKKKNYFTYFQSKDNDSTSLYNNRVYCIYVENKNRVWVGNQVNLQLFDPESGTFSTFPKIYSPKCFVEDINHKLWIGTRTNGLFVLDLQTEEVINYRNDPKNPESLPSDELNDLKFDQEGNLWIASAKGLACFSENKFKTYSILNGLPSDRICAMEFDLNNNLWISSTNGLSKFDNARQKFQNFNIGDGLQGNEFESFVSLKTSDGHLVFGGANGFNCFNPKEIEDNTRIPELAFTAFKLFNKEITEFGKGSPLKKHISVIDTIVLNHNQSTFSFEYAVLNYTSPEKNSYSYKLEGFDTEWVMAKTNNSASYTNIPPGNYTFSIRGANNDGYWNEEGSSIVLEILPPPWKTGWAYLIYALTMFGLFLAIRRVTLLRIKQKNLIEFERKDKERLQEINQMKLRFFTNISHEFRTPLTLISSPLNKLRNHSDTTEDQRYLLNLMNSNVNRLLLLINELMDFRKAENEHLKLHIESIDMLNFIEQVLFCFKELAISKEIDLSFKHNLIDAAEFWFDKAIIDKVLFNILSNAFKYTNSKGRIIVAMELKGDVIRISVNDTGIGIPKSELKGIFDRYYQVEKDDRSDIGGTGIGLAFIKKLIEAHYGTINVESIVHVGSVFSVTFPISKQYYLDKGIKISNHSTLEDIPYEHYHPQEVKIKPDTGETEQKNSKTQLLVVEDNEEMANYIATILTDFEVRLAPNGLIGLQLATANIPDVIISDIMMPEMDGVEMCQRLKSQYTTCHIPIVLLSAKTDISQKIQGLEQGADAYVDKPFDAQYLTTVLHNLIRQRELLRQKYSDQPEQILSESSLSGLDKKFIENSLEIIRKNLPNENFSVEQFSTEIGMSRSQLNRKLKALFQLSPNELIRNERFIKAKELLQTGDLHVNEVAYKIGFKSASHFITSFKKQFGFTPSEFPKKRT